MPPSGGRKPVSLMTRSELGYDWWKEDVKHVARAREIAKSFIARAKLRRQFIEPLERFVNRNT